LKELVGNDAALTRVVGDLEATKMSGHPVLAAAFAEAGRRIEQVLSVTGTTTWAAAMKKLREPGPRPPALPSGSNRSGVSAADRRYGGPNR
jgi:hypothetical protein